MISRLEAKYAAKTGRDVQIIFFDPSSADKDGKPTKPPIVYNGPVTPVISEAIEKKKTKKGMKRDSEDKIIQETPVMASERMFKVLQKVTGASGSSNDKASSEDKFSK